MHGRVVIGALLAAACGGAAAGPAGPAPEAEVVRVPPALSLGALEQRIRARVAQESGGEVSVALVDLGTGLRMDVDGGVPMHAASTMKVPVMLEVFRQMEGRRLSLDERLAVSTQFRSIVGDSLYTLTPASDSDSALYGQVGGSAPIRELVRLMIVRSSNLALNLLIARVGPDNVMATMREIGAAQMHVRRGVEDLPAFRAGLNNTTTAIALVHVLEAIVRCSVTLRSSCDQMIEILAAQEFNDMIPAGVPAGTRVANKTGWITGIQHDGAIVFPPGRPPYVLAILTRGLQDTARARAAGADISRLVWQQLTEPGFNTFVRPVDENTRTLLELHQRVRVGAIGQRHFGHGRLWRTLDSLAAGPLQREEAGVSAEGRAIRVLRFGTGATRVLLWSQMHGDESTATMTLVDLVNYLRQSEPDVRARGWAERLTILMVPMLNPDGAERFQRHNALGIDVNRDARALATPEGQTLRSLRDRYQPAFGFNLHDQNPRTRVGRTGRLAAISLLAPPLDASGTATERFILAQHVAARIRSAIEPLVGGHITKYDDSFNPRAFGDLMQQWGTSTVLIESGGWRGDPEKQFLRAVNFVALVSALDAIAAQDFRNTPTSVYHALPPNGRAVNDLLIRGGTVVVRGLGPYRADVAADEEGGSGGPPRARITEIGDLAEVEARDTLDVPGLFLHAVVRDTLPARRLLPGMDATFDVRTGAQPDSELVFRIERGVRSAARH